MKKYLILFIAALAASLAACSDDPTDMGSVDGPGAESAVLRLSIPGAEEVAVYSGGSVSECEIKTLYLFIFRSGSLVWTETFVGTSSQNIIGNGTSQLTVSFSGGTVPQAGDKVYVIANPPTFTGMGMQGSLHFSVQTSLGSVNAGSPITETGFLDEKLAGDNPFLNTSASGFTPDGMYASGMPMFGCVEWQGTGSNICTLVRSVAKVRIVDAGTDNDIATLFPGKTVEYGFAGTPTAVGIGVDYNSATQKYESRSISSGQLSFARWGSVPTGGTTTVGYVPTTRLLYPWPWLNATKVPNTIGGSLSYLASISGTSFDNRRCALMLRVTDNTTGDEEFYRLDFARQTKGTSFVQDAEYEYLDIDPNTSYTFRVGRVLSRGYSSETEAWQNPGSNLEFTLDITHLNSVGAFPPDEGYVVSNGQYGLQFSEKEVQLGNGIGGSVYLRYKGVVNSSSAPELTNRTVALVGADKKTLIPFSQVKFAENSTLTGSNLVDVSSVPFTDIRNIMIDANPPGAPTPNPLPSGGMYLRFVAGNITEYIPVKCNTLRVTGGGSVPYTGGTLPVTVTSYSGVSGTDSSEPWIAEFSTDNGSTWSTTAPAWLTGIPANGTGSITAQNFTARVAATPRQYFNSHAVALKAAPAVSDYDLSTNGGTTAVNTANCYLVNAPGTYRLPLVYGNGIKNGVTNASAYTSTASGSTILGRFLNHLGVGIAYPYIYSNGGCVPADCCLVWQDADGLVSNVHLSDDHHYLEFEVAQATICQGNAVVAVRDASNRIMWSWHIWVTDYKLGTELQETTNSTGFIYKFLPYNIGWCDESSCLYPARSVKVRVTQQVFLPTQGRNLSQTFTINQEASPTSYSMSGNNPYFQWGRKDPMLPGFLNGGSNATENKDFYYYDSAYSWGAENLGTSIENYIQTPHSFNTNSAMDNLYYNLWNANNNVATLNDDPVVKTVYDPSPVGFCMPPSNAWTGLVARGVWTTSVSPAGYNFTVPGGTCFYPASGLRRAESAGLSDFGGSGYCWSGGPFTVFSGYNLAFDMSNFLPVYNRNRGCGYSVRPVRE